MEVELNMQVKDYQVRKVVMAVDRFNYLATERAKEIFYQRFAVGNQARSHTSEENKVIKYVYYPATGIDWLKKILVEWVPELNFGWLCPRITRTPVTYKTVHDTYYNVNPLYGVDEFDERYIRYEYVIGNRLKGSGYPQNHRDIDFQNSPVNWLDATPCTREEVAKARDELWSAYWFATHHLHFLKTSKGPGR